MRILIMMMTILALVPASLSGQEVRGRVVDDATERPIAGARMELLRPSGELVATFLSDTNGKFTLRAPREGNFTVRGSAPGYMVSRGQQVTLLSLDTLRIEFRLSPDAVLLTPIVVEVDRPMAVPARLIPYYERRDWYGRMGRGRFFDTEELENWKGLRITSLLRDVGRLHFVPVPYGRAGEYVLSDRRDSRCSVTVYIDGVRDRGIGTVRELELSVIMSQIAAVEVYRRSEVPADFDPACGVVAIWLH
jgi:hypothetical protein